MTNANAAEDAAREVVESNAQADERQVPGAEYVAKLRGHGPEHGPLAGDVAAERAYEERQAQVRDRDLCRCNDQRAAHDYFYARPPCQVTGCSCTGYKPSGDNLEQSLEAMSGSDELASWRLLGWEMAPRMHDLLHRERGMDALERDVVALPPDGSPQQRWLGDAQALVNACRQHAKETLSNELIDYPLWNSVNALAQHLDTMPAPFDWAAAGNELYDTRCTHDRGTPENFAEALKRLWLGGTHAGD